MQDARAARNRIVVSYGCNNCMPWQRVAYGLCLQLQRSNYGGKGSRGFQPSPPLKAGPVRSGCSGPCPVGLWISPGMETLQILCSSVWPLPFPFYLVRIAHVPVCPSCISSCYRVWRQLLYRLPTGSCRQQWQQSCVWSPCPQRSSEHGCLITAIVSCNRTESLPVLDLSLPPQEALRWGFPKLSLGWDNSKYSPGNSDLVHSSSRLDIQRCTVSRHCTEFVPLLIDTKICEQGDSDNSKAVCITCNLFLKGTVPFGTAQRWTSSSPLNRSGAQPRELLLGRKQKRTPELCWDLSHWWLPEVSHSW